MNSIFSQAYGIRIRIPIAIYVNEPLSKNNREYNSHYYMNITTYILYTRKIQLHYEKNLAKTNPSNARNPIEKKNKTFN